MRRLLPPKTPLLLPLPTKSPLFLAMTWARLKCQRCYDRRIHCAKDGLGGEVFVPKSVALSDAQVLKTNAHREFFSRASHGET